MGKGNGGGRVRVVIAGNIYTKRSLVKRFLEDDGFYVVAEAMTRPELGAALDATDPDALVVDEELLGPGGAGIAAIRRRVPGAKIVVFTSGLEERPEGADGYLEKGVGLATLTAMLGRLCSEPTIPMEAALLAGASRAPRAALRVGALAVAATIAIVLAAVLFSGGGTSPVGHPESDTSGGPLVENGGGPTLLELAKSDLALLLEALESGSYVAARAYAGSLMLHREEAITLGFSVGALDERIGAALSPLMGTLAPRVIPFLQDILGDLLPPVPTSGGGSGDGSTGSTGGGTSTGGDTSTGGTSTGGTGGGGDGEGGGGGDGEGGGGDGDGGGDNNDNFPGNGKHLGWVHKPPHGGWHGHKPE